LWSGGASASDNSDNLDLLHCFLLDSMSASLLEAHEVCGASQSHLSSYALTLMAIYFMQVTGDQMGADAHRFVHSSSIICTHKPVYRVYRWCHAWYQPLQALH
jgi:hypothetical protein